MMQIVLKFKTISICRMKCYRLTVENDRPADDALIGKHAIVLCNCCVLGKIVSLKSPTHLLTSKSIHSPKKNIREQKCVFYSLLNFKKFWDRLVIGYFHFFP